MEDSTGSTGKIEIAAPAEAAIEEIFKTNLGVRRNERVFVFTDTVGENGSGESLSEEERTRREGTCQVAKKVAQVGRGLCRIQYLEFPSRGSHGSEPPLDAWKIAFGGLVAYRLMELDIIDAIIAKKATEKMLSAAEEIIKECRDDKSPRAIEGVIALSNFSTTHTRFREFLTTLMGVRYASMPVFEESMLSGVMGADWDEVAKRTEALASRMEGSDSVRITTPLGTDVRFSIKGRAVLADTGILTEPGSFGNLPAGEAYAAPVEGTAEGRLVLEWAPTRKLASPVTLIVREGRVVEVEGEEEYASTLRETIEGEPLCANIAELGVGTNDKATRADNILESEKILGTIHIALGDNSTFGGTVSVPFHQDFVFFSPTVVLVKGGSEATILEGGRLAL